jgi:hypothetical protein
VGRFFEQPRQGLVVIFVSKLLESVGRPGMVDFAHLGDQFIQAFLAAIRSGIAEFFDYPDRQLAERCRAERHQPSAGLILGLAAFLVVLDNVQQRSELLQQLFFPARLRQEIVGPAFKHHVTVLIQGTGCQSNDRRFVAARPRFYDASGF